MEPMDRDQKPEKDPSPKAPDNLISLEEIRRLMEMGPGPNREERSPSNERVAEWAKLCVTELVTLAEAFAFASLETPGGIFIQPQIIQIMAVLDSLMAVLSDPKDDRPGHRVVREYLLDYFGKTLPEEP